MSFKVPKRKKHSPYQDFPSFPGGTGKFYTSFYNGFDVTVSDYNDMIDIYYKGSFGKGSLSRGPPRLRNEELPDMILEQQWLNRSSMCSECVNRGTKRSEKSLYRASVDEFLRKTFDINEEASENWKSWKRNELPDRSMPNNMTVVTDSWKEKTDVPVSDYSSDLLCGIVDGILTSMKGKCEPHFANSNDSVVLVVSDPKDSSFCEHWESLKVELKPNFGEPVETLKLMNEEAFFLHYALECLIIKNDDGVVMSTECIWNMFKLADCGFVDRYVVYHYYRAKGWVVRAGLKYGGDLVLYKKGPAYYHSTYVVRVVKSGVELSWDQLVGVNRLVETVNKGLLVCQVTPPHDMTPAELSSPAILPRYSVSEMCCCRWVPTQQRVSKP